MKNLLLTFLMFFSACCSCLENNKLSNFTRGLDLNEGVGDEVIVSGYLFAEGEAAVIYSSIDDFFAMKTEESLKVDGLHESYKSLSGCYVNLSGKIKHHAKRKREYVISNVNSVTRGGYLFIKSTEILEENRVSKMPKCMIPMIIDQMVKSTE